LKSKDGNHTQFWRIAAFSEPVQVELMRLTARDAVAVEGALKAELYDRDGEIELLFGVLPSTSCRCASRATSKRRKAELLPKGQTPLGHQSSFNESAVLGTAPATFRKAVFYEARNSFVHRSI
jgi:hypothetical protein